MEDYGRYLLADSPEHATALGLAPDSANARRLDDRSALSIDLRRTAALRGLARIEAMDPDELGESERVRYAALAGHFQAARLGAELPGGHFSAYKGFRPYVLDPFRGAFAALPRFLEGQHAIEDLADAEDYLARLRLVARAIDEELERARLDADSGAPPPASLLERVERTAGPLAALPAAQTPFVQSLRSRLEAFLGPIDAPDAPVGAASPQLERGRALLAQAEQITQRSILPAYQRTAQLAGALLRRAQPGPPAETLRAWHEAGLTFSAGGAVDAEKAEAQALQQVSRLSAQLDMSLRGLGLIEGAPSARLASLAADPRYSAASLTASEMSALLRNHHVRAEKLKTSWFLSPPTARVDFRVLQSWAPSGRRLAYEPPPSAEASRPGVVLINPEALARSPRTEFATLAFHETWPGHHAQAAVALQAAPSLTLQILHFPAYSEGWATYAEQLADEFGLYESDPVGRIGYLRWQLIRAARLVVDAGLHRRGWTRDQAIAYLENICALERDTAAYEVDRMLAAPGLASSYELGRSRIAAARDRAQIALGPAFDIRRFHQIILADGELPLHVLDQLVDAWITREAQRS